MNAVSSWLDALREYAWTGRSAAAGDRAVALSAVKILKAECGVDWSQRLLRAQKEDAKSERAWRKHAAVANLQLRHDATEEEKQDQEKLRKLVVDHDPNFHHGQAERSFLAEATLAIKRLAWTKEWMDSGFPQVVVQPKLFASLAATDVPAGLLPDELGYPWECFVLRVPEEFHSSAAPWYPNGDQRLLSPGFIVSRAGEMDSDTVRTRRLHIHAAQKASLTVDFQFQSLESLYRAAASYLAGLGLSHDDDVGRMITGDERIHYVARKHPSDGKGVVTALTDTAMEQCDAMRRAFAGVVMEMMEPRYRAAIEKTKARSRPQKRGDQLKANTFVLSRPVVVDVRDWIRSAMTGAGARGPHTVQAIVRGHWKRQAHGPNGSLRKHVHIEPYLRGAPDAPLAVRRHSLVARGTAPP